MADSSEFSAAAWEVMLAAKACCLADDAPEIGARHLLRACAWKCPELVKAALASIEPDEPAAARLLKSLAQAPDTRDLDAARRTLAGDALDVVAQAKRHSLQRPVTPERLIAPVHVWAGACAAAPRFEPWLRERGWTEAQVHALPAAAERQLPELQASAAANLTDEQRGVMNKLCQRNLSELARSGQLTVASGADEVRMQLVACLLRRDKRNAVLTGRAGVGKTKIVEDLACRIGKGEIPELAGCEVFELDLTSLTRGTHLAGSRAERFAQLTNVLKAHPEQLILFIDELHTIVGLPMEGGAMDLSNALKPMLVDARVRIVGATTTEEYGKHIEGDPALSRRFSQVMVPEPDRDTMMSLLRDIAPRYEAYHGVQYAPDALDAIYDLSQRYVPNQAFPAKAVDLMDEAGVQARLGARDNPAGAAIEVTTGIVSAALGRVRGVAATLPAGDLAGLLSERVIGQEQAAQMLARAVITSAGRFDSRPHKGARAAILFLGPPGVGKSYMAEVLADILFAGRRTMLTIDMSEFSGPHAGEQARFRLLGAPPPYVGWENGGLLTAHVQQHPMSVVLVDELDKSVGEARNILLKILNDGWVQDGRGRMVSFEGVIFILTANAARGLWETRRHPGFGISSTDGAPVSEQTIRSELEEERFSPELMSRISHLVLFNRLGVDELRRIVATDLAAVRDAALADELMSLQYDEGEVTSWLVDNAGATPDARRVNVAFENLVQGTLAEWRWQRTGKAQPTIVRLRPAGRSLELDVQADEAAVQEVRRLLFARLASAFDQSKGDVKTRTASARIVG